MGSTLGNILGLLAVTLPVALGLLVSFRAGAIAHAAFSYGAWLLLRLTTAAVTPRREIPFLAGLSDDEARVFRRYFVALTHPNAGELYSAGLNVVRIVGCFWAVISLFKGLYVLGVVLGIFFFVSGGLIMRHHPSFYLQDAGPRLQGIAQEELWLLEAVKGKLDRYYAERRSALTK